MEYQLLATDLDGTLLRADKAISAGNIAAIRRALDMGKHVVFSTGRSLGEVEDLMSLFEKMRYVLCESGALIYDRKENRIISRDTLDPALTRKILLDAQQRDIMIQVMMDGRSVMNRTSIAMLEHYRNEYLRAHFLKTAVLVDDVVAECASRGWQAEKLCLYHPDEVAREASLHRVRNDPLTATFSERTSLELTPTGIDKGEGLRRLCRVLHIAPEEAIVIGDAPNDMEILQEAGLPIAVGNAAAEIKMICRAVVADNEHDGVREAIDTWLCPEPVNPERTAAYHPAWAR